MIFANWYDDACSMFGWTIIFFLFCMAVIGHKMRTYTAQNPEVGKATAGIVVRLIGRLLK